MTEKSHSATQIYAMEHNRHTRGVTKASPDPGNHIGKRDPEENGDDELALLGGYTRVIRSSKDSASPGSSTGLAQSGYSPERRNVSPGTTDPGSLPETGLTFTDQPAQWEMHQSAIYQQARRSDDRVYSPSVATTEHHSSAGSASSGMSPVPSIVIPVQHERYTHNDSLLKPFETPQGEMEIQYRGIPAYEYVNGVPEQTLGIGRYEGEGVRIARHPSSYPSNGPQQHVNYVPMDVSTAPESQDWNFLDDWYGHVFQLDAIPPDYGKSTTS